MKQVWMLDGEWQLTGQRADGSGVGPLSAVVPGDVHDDLERGGIIPPILWRDNAEQCQWVEYATWTFSRELELPVDWQPSERCVLHCAGLDTLAEIRVNGVLVGQTHNMFVPHEFAVGNLLHPGINTIQIIFEPATHAATGKDPERHFACFNWERVYIRKMQCAFGWDWVHRLVGVGIWRSIWLEQGSSFRLQSMFIHTRALETNRAHLALQLEVEYPPATGWAQYRVLDSAGVPVAQGELGGGEHSWSTAITMASPELWWPNGYGEQPLYQLEVLLYDGELVVDSQTTSFGIRTVVIEERPDERGSSFTLVVNGVRIFAKGGNWVPADPFPGRIPDAKYDHLLRLAGDGHHNMLRVWGGGLFEPEAFWSACDRYGIMISQDFLLACASYPETEPWFQTEIAREVEWAVRAFRNHPSLVFWCGNNELGMGSKPEEDHDGKLIGTTVIEPLCRQLDPSRPFRLTSPYGGEINNSPDEGDSHLSAWYDPAMFLSDMHNYREQIAALDGRFLSESAVPGAPPLSSLRKFMTDDDIVDPNGAMWEYHTNDNPYSGIDLTHYRLLEKTARCLFGDPADPWLRVRQMGYAHYEWIRLTVENLRRRKYDSSGIQFWMYNDCWPASGWSHVDYYGFPKAGYYAAKRTFAPLIASIEDADSSLRLWVCNDTRDDRDVALDMRVVNWQGEVSFEKRFTVLSPANASQTVWQIAKQELPCVQAKTGVLVCDLSVNGQPLDRAWYFEGMPYEMQVQPTRLTITSTEEGDSKQGTLTVTSTGYARVVTIEGDAIFSDNYFDLLPGESKQVTWWVPAGVARNSISVSAWNALDEQQV